MIIARAGSGAPSVTRTTITTDITTTTTTHTIDTAGIVVARVLHRTPIKVTTSDNTLGALPRRLGTATQKNLAQGRQDLRNQTPVWLRGVRTLHAPIQTADRGRDRSNLAIVLTPGK
jgi:hypothetical protein